MEKQGFRGVTLLVVFIWSGMLLGISFLEAPLKFQAPNVTLGIGLGIGRLVFGTLNKVEIVYCLSLIVFSFITKPAKQLKYLLGIITFILIIQTAWLLPALDARAQIIIDGGMAGESSIHLYYVVAEIVKLILLITFGINFFSETVKNNLKSLRA